MQAMKYSYARPNAAVGQSGLQALYETMFRNYGIIVGQVLVTKSDFYNEETRTQLFSTLNELMALNIIPIINTNELVNYCCLLILSIFTICLPIFFPSNQLFVYFFFSSAVSPPPQKDEDVDGILGIKDNDSLAARVAVEINADLAILMSDVDGIYDR